MNKETLEEAAKNHAIKKREIKHLSNREFDLCQRDFISGTKWQEQIMHSDMQEYATFCILSDREGLPILLVKDWFEQFKNK